jgi:uncharacterized membrane protein YgcG
MKKIICVCSILITICLISGIGSAAVSIPGRTKTLVNDYAGVVSPEVKSYLENLLGALKADKRKGTEIVVTTIKSLEGMPFDQFIEGYSRRWRQSFLVEKDNRIHIIIIVNDQRMRIGVGLFVRNIITPDKVREIMAIMISGFSKGDYNEGIKNGTETIVKILNQANYPNYSPLFNLRNALIAVLVIWFIVRRFYRKRGQKNSV